ncbi:ketopantoate hydroxymethyltransferase [Candidatus Nitrososphaera evergladensis SR1]|uniref:3-methyl-2-oxobutanoate hydroxymethyltransferase n=1 Tax=Candidatus Nitrososphaera evergladensis SR1 TaxID=1459636 RepID=A0A075MZG6_9ARCH|nr:3-methyl-2-oxobutanoate hydroxymethyltransferase [Candidatus Nitrososphaera evergladensis]AIF84644.1 ketopantoate hydroxymethyltransferase [Candidatus Nitrososphaera evergladensis SR1]
MTQEAATSSAPKKNKKVSVSDLALLKSEGKEKISVLTAYDYSTALICDRAGVDVLLVGDSAGMVVLGHPSTVPVNMQEMLMFCGAVSRGAKRAMIIGDMPFGSYQPSTSMAIENAVQFIKGGCDAVKLEGGAEIADKVKAIVDAGVPVMGHIGLKPQTSSLWEGYRLQGRTAESAQRLVQDAQALEKAGVFSIVLEMVASEVAEVITRKVSVPTIGIGSGPECDGQVLVLHDLLGIYEDIKPKFVKRYAELAKPILDAVSSYTRDVKAGKFPDEQNTFHMNPEELEKFQGKGKKK